MFPDRATGFSELHRVLRPGGRALVASWQPQDQIPAFATISQTLMAHSETTPGTQEQPLSNADTFAREMSAAGFDVTIEAYTHTMKLPGFATLWRGLSQAHVALAIAKKQLPADEFQSLMANIEKQLKQTLGEGPQTLEMAAWFGIGRKS